MKNIKSILLVAAAMLAAAPAFADVPIKAGRGLRDTVYNKNLNLVLMTSPTATASINGEEVHVYKTGTFGKQIVLEEGLNEIKVKATDKGETAEQTFKVVYTTKQPRMRMGGGPRPEFIEGTGFSEILMYGVTKEGAYLKFGNGDERLGGTKMGYLAPGIPLKLVSQNKDMYCAQLSNNRVAYIDKEYVEIGGAKPRVINSGNFSISNAGKTDDVYLSLPAKVPYYSWIELDPTILYVDLYGVTNNSNWITHKMGLGMIEYVDVRQVEGDVLRLVIKFKHKYSWGYHIAYSGNNLVINVKHTPENLTLKGMTVCLDAGHGGSAPGALGYTGLEEKVVNMQLVQETKRILESKGAIVTLTRKGDEGPDDRIVEAGNPDLFISFHNNSGGSPFAQLGTSCYYKYICNREYAECILNRLLELGQNCFGLVGNFNFNLCRPTEYPCMLIEGLFMNSLAEEEMLMDPAFRTKFCEKAVQGVEDYLQKVKDSLPAAPSKKASKKK